MRKYDTNRLDDVLDHKVCSCKSRLLRVQPQNAFRSSIFVAVVMALLVVVGSALGDATLTDVSTVAAGDNALVSVTTNAFQGFATNSSPTVDTPFNNPVRDYRFYGSNPAFGNSGSGGVSRVSALTNPGTGIDYTDYWITSDPLTEPADQSNSGSRSFAGSTSGSIDISGLTAGTLYIFHGRWQSLQTDYLDLVMTGAGQTDVTLSNAGATVAGAPIIWVTRIDFTDSADDYQTITFVHHGSSDGYLSGTVLTVPPPPSGTVITIK